MHLRNATTPELLLYLVIVLLFSFVLMKTGTEVSSHLLRNRKNKLLPGLRNGWILNRPVDLSDPQWRDFRQGVFPLSVAMFCYVFGSVMVKRHFFPYWKRFSLVCSLFFVAYLHGTNAIQLLIALLLSYTLCKTCLKFRRGVWLFWIGHGILYFCIRWLEGFPFPPVETFKFLAKTRGPVRWHITFNLSLLRVLSFGMDYFWAIHLEPKKETHHHYTDTLKDGAEMDSIKRRSKAALDPMNYNIMSFLCYVLYPPLYLAGPISTFNNFERQIRETSQIRTLQVSRYGLRLAFDFLVMEFVTHFVYVGSITKYNLMHSKWTSGMNPGALEFGSIAMWVLIFIWLKFLIIWRYFRFWAKLDGIDTTENMKLCIFNNYNSEGFWRHWHASFNQWIVRYLYVPLGGRRHKWANIWLVFIFVGLWHDLEIKLLYWAVVAATFFMIEQGIKHCGMYSFSEAFRTTCWYRHISAAFAALNSLLLITANTIGFGTGADGAWALVTETLNNPVFLCKVYFSFYAMVQIMFWLRREDDLSCLETHVRRTE